MFYILVTTVLTLLSSAVSQNWCSLDCENWASNMKIKNTMCQYQSQTNTGACRNIKPSSTDESKKKILHLHNQYRNELAGGQKAGWPSAANMNQLTWDHDLETVALRWAQQCQAGHDKCRRTATFKDVGQNYAMVGSSMSYPEDPETFNFKSWVDEISIAHPSLVDRFQSGAWGHFTAVNWATTKAVGCGEVQFQEGQWFRSVLICDYGPAGNWLNEPMYKKGPACSACPAGSQCVPQSAYPNLCTVPGQAVGTSGKNTEGNHGNGPSGEMQNQEASRQPSLSQPNKSPDSNEINRNPNPSKPGKGSIIENVSYIVNFLWISVLMAN